MQWLLEVQRMNSFEVWPSLSEMSPDAPGRTTYKGFCGLSMTKPEPT